MFSRSEALAESICEQLVSAAGAVLDQCEALVRATPEGVFASESRAMHGGTLGKHLRHTLDHYIAALGVVGEVEGVINYDRRKRKTSIETDRSAAMEAIDELRARLVGAASEGTGRRVRVQVMIDSDGTEVDLASTLGRELAFATHHAVHHQAMMKAIASEFGIEVEESFGKAPSTLKAEREHRGSSGRATVY